MTHGSLFAGIGGIDLGFEWAGIETIWQVEINDYCNKVLELRFPDVKRYRDIRNVYGGKCHHKWHKHNKAIELEERQELTGVDIISGGFP